MRRIRDRVDTVPQLIHFPVPETVLVETEARIHKEIKKEADRIKQKR